MIRRIVTTAAVIAAVFFFTACAEAQVFGPQNNGSVLRQLYGLNQPPRCTLNNFQASNTVTKFLSNGAARLSEAWFNPTSVPVYLFFDSSVSTTRGILLQANGGFFSLDFRSDTVLPTYEMWGVTAAQGAFITEVDCSVQ